MAVSAIDICNMALGHCGRTVAGIQSFSEKSAEARICALWYDPSRREALEAHDWGFARQRLSLALHSDAPPDEWSFRYRVPSDMLAIRRIWNPLSNVILPFPGAGWPGLTSYGGDLGDAIPYQLEASANGEEVTLLTNQESAVLIYTRDATLTQLFPSLFVNALAHLVASKIAYPLTTKTNIAQMEAQTAQAALRLAAGSDANQGMGPAERDAYAIRSRF